jgi:hypothetical protein
MKLDDFRIGGEFWCGDRQWRCTDKGTRTITAICISQLGVHSNLGDRQLNREKAEAEGWFNGPPYAVPEKVFDEYDQEGCTDG